MGTQVSHARSLEIAKETVRHMVRWEQPGEPHSYEIWYHYSAGYPSHLKRAMDRLIEEQGRITEADLDQLRRQHLRDGSTFDKLDDIGETFSGEVEQVLAMVEEAIGLNVSIENSLTTARTAITPAIDRPSLRAIIEAIVLTAKKAQDENGKLGSRLQETLKSIAQLQENLESVRLDSLTDPLTGVANRRYFDQFLSKALSAAEETNTPLSLLFADVDHFKAFNDDHGHQLGDQVLRLIATSLKQSVKSQGFVARYGGEEFAVVLPNLTHTEAVTVAEDICRAIAANDIIVRTDGSNLGRVTVSVGIGSFRRGMGLQSLVDAADACLYAAKRRGRNCVISESELS